MTTTYELTKGTREEFDNVQARLIADFIEQFTGVEVENTIVHKLGKGKVVSCSSTVGTLEHVTFKVEFENETKNLVASVAISSGFLKFTDESMLALYDNFMEVHANLKHQLFEADMAARRHEKEEAKKAEQLKKAEAKNKTLKEKAIKDFEALTQQAKKVVAQQDEFYYALGWLAKHVGSVSAVLPDYLEGAFVKHFGDEAPRRVVDSNKRTVNGNSMQWTFGFTATLRKAEDIPAMLVQYLGHTGKAIANTSFIWDIVTDYGFKFGKKQDTLEIMRCVPIEYVPMFNEGMNA